MQASKKASLQAMEDIYVNVNYDKAVCPVPATDHTGSSSSKRSFYLAVILFLGLLSVCLLVGLIVLGVHYHDSAETAADLFAIRDNLTERLQAENDKLSSLTEERNQLKANLSKITTELNRLESLSKQKKRCPAGWRSFSCSCYLLSTRSASWDEGREDCRGRGADLVVIEDAEEQNFLSAFVKTQSWIGLSDKETEGVWKWVDGTTLTLTSWSKDQPDNGGGSPWWGEEDCVQLISDDTKSWNDIKCTTSMQWICEKEPTYFA